MGSFLLVFTVMVRIVGTAFLALCKHVFGPLFQGSFTGFCGGAAYNSFQPCASPTIIFRGSSHVKHSP